MSKDYTGSLNLPVTDFAMRANLPQREPEMLRYWESVDLYHTMLKNSADKPLFILHDGPSLFQRKHPYGNCDEQDPEGFYQ